MIACKIVIRANTTYRSKIPTGIVNVYFTHSLLHGFHAKLDSPIFMRDTVARSRGMRFLKVLTGSSHCIGLLPSSWASRTGQPVDRGSIHNRSVHVNVAGRPFAELSSLFIFPAQISEANRAPPASTE